MGKKEETVNGIEEATEEVKRRRKSSRHVGDGTTGERKEGRRKRSKEGRHQTGETEEREVCEYDARTRKRGW